MLSMDNLKIGTRLLIIRTVGFCLCCLVLFASHLQAADSCFTIHGRAHLYGGDGQLRIWHVGTHHDFRTGRLFLG
jgi:hypothetical protein